MIELEIDPASQKSDTVATVAKLSLTFNTPEEPIELSYDLNINLIHQRFANTKKIFLTRQSDQGKCTSIDDDVFVNNQMRLAAEIDEQVLA